MEEEEEEEGTGRMRQTLGQGERRGDCMEEARCLLCSTRGKESRGAGLRSSAEKKNQRDCMRVLHGKGGIN